MTARETPKEVARSIPVDGVLVGHWTAASGTTGVTVVLVPEGAVGGVDVRGGAPASRETDLLRPENLVQEVHGVVLSGGSAFGLDAASGVMRWLEERGHGFATRAGVVPIVVGASLYDLGFGGGEVRPDAEAGYAAASAAGATFAVGSVGAGSGATVGKLRGPASAMRGGLGAATVELVDGTGVTALAAVNAVGDVVDPATGEVVAGAQEGGVLLDVRRVLWSASPALRENTTLVAVVTDARLTQAQATRVAQMAQDGLARALVPSHTPVDGDTVFTLATGGRDGEPDLLRIGAAAARAVELAILDAVRSARTGFGVLASGDVEPPVPAAP